MPRNIYLFERLLYLSVALSVLSTLLAVLVLRLPPSDRTFGGSADIVAEIIFSLIISALIWGAARRHRGWCLGLLIVLYALAIITGAMVAPVEFARSAVTAAIDFLGLAVGIIGLGFALTGDARDYFRKSSAVA